MAKSSRKYSKAEKRSWWNGVRYGRNGPVVFWDGDSPF